MSPRPRAASNVEWERWGETDPFWGVASWPGRQHGGVNPWTPKEFYDFGSQDWAAYRTRWDNYGRPSGRCVEIGCGAGRLTMHIAHDFDRIVGIDVAEGMLRVAREHVTAANVEFRLSNGVEIPVADSSTDGVFSALVFQHFESFELGLANFAEVARVLRPEGSAMIQLPVYNWPKGLTAAESVLGVRRHLVAWRARVQRRRRKPVMRWLAYSNDWLFRSCQDSASPTSRSSPFLRRATMTSTRACSCAAAVTARDHLLPTPQDAGTRLPSASLFAALKQLTFSIRLSIRARALSRESRSSANALEVVP